MKVHAITQCFPMMADDEMSELAGDIKKRGLIYPVTMLGDLLLDGRNRIEACKRAGVKVRSVEFDGDDAAGFIISTNKRRNLDVSQRAMVAARMANIPKHKHKTDSSKELSQDEAATALGVSLATVKRAKAVMDADLELAEQVAQGEVTLAKAQKVIRRKKQQARMKEAAQRNRSTSDLWTLTDKQDVISCAALITDPPYGILNEKWEPSDVEDMTRGWAAKWDKCGADTLLVFFSQRFLWEGRAWFDESFNHYHFQQLLVWHYANNKKPQSQDGFKQTWEPIFFYRRKDTKRKIVPGSEEWGKGLNCFDCHVAAVPQSNFNEAEQKVHPAQKPVSVFRWLINAVTDPGELVCDPFCGVGTSGIAAMQLGRKWHGIEIEKDYLGLAKKRIAAYGKPV